MMGVRAMKRAGTDAPRRRGKSSVAASAATLETRAFMTAPHPSHSVE
jgi:hypothetical protein